MEEEARERSERKETERREREAAKQKAKAEKEAKSRKPKVDLFGTGAPKRNVFDFEKVRSNIFLDIGHVHS